MSSTTNMNIVLPTPTMDDGVWGDTLNTGLGVVDAHDHTPGKGVAIPSTAITVAADLDFKNYSLYDLKESRLNDQGAALTGTTHSRGIQAAGGNLYYINGSGTAVQITDGASLATSVSAPALPPGATIPYAGTSAPSGWLLCDGTAVSRVTYATLFGVVGTVYGVGDGATTFNVPNMSGRAAVGTGTYTDSVSGVITRTLAQVAGTEAHVLTSGQMPSHNHTQDAHTHTVTDPGHSHTLSTPIYRDNGSSSAYEVQNLGTAGTQSTVNSATTGVTNQTAVATNQATGGGTAHNNMQPFLGLLYIIKT